MKFKLLQVAIVTVLVGAAAPALAGGDVNQNGELGLFTLRSGHTYNKGEWGFGLYGNEWDWRVPSDDDFKDIDPLWSNWDLRHRRASAGVGFGLSDRFELDLMVPYEWYHARNVDDLGHRSVGHLYGHNYVGELDATGWGNIGVGATIGLSRYEKGGLALRAFFDTPTGDDNEGTVTGDWGWSLGLAWTGGNWTFNGAYHDLGDPDVVQNIPLVGPVKQETSPRVELGLGYGVPFGDRWEWITELVGAIMTESTGEYDIANLTSGGRYYFGDDNRWAFNVGLRLDVSHNDLSGTGPIGGLIGLTYSNSAKSYTGTTRQAPAPPPPPTAPPPPPAAAPPSPPPPPAAPSKPGLTVRNTGTGNGTTSSTPPGIDCGSDCRETYDTGTAVRLAQKPDACSSAGGFGGDCSNDGSVTMSADKTCTSTFNGKPLGEQTFAACEKYGAWDCKTGLRETVAFNGTMLSTNAVTKDGHGKLCDWANQLRACPALRVCVAGGNTASEDKCVGTQRSDVVVQFFRRQSNESAFSGISSRVQGAPTCSPEDEKGAVVNLQMR